MSWLEALIAMLLSITGAGTATEQADRVAPPDPTVPVLDIGSLEGCARAEALRFVSGLPPVFDRLARRESGPNCDNNAVSPTGCCVGYWQLHEIVFRDHRTRAGMEACGATWFNVRGNTLESQVRQACATKVLYDVDGLSPWALS